MCKVLKELQICKYIKCMGTKIIQMSISSFYFFYSTLTNLSYCKQTRFLFKSLWRGLGDVGTGSRGRERGLGVGPESGR